MRIASSTEEVDRGKLAVRTAVDHGYTLFDHADIYGGGACEKIFGEVLAESPGLREQLTILTKCGVRTDDPARYDASYDHIVSSVDGSLARLGVEQIDALLLHRPDYLMGVEEVARAFDDLLAAGKVREFGVSNFPPEKLAALQSALSVKLQVNQVEMNIHNIDAFENGMLDQCQSLGISPQAWCPLGGIVWDAWGNTFSPEQTARVRQEASRQAAYYGIESWQLALVWLLRHPAGIIPILGSTTPERIAAATKALHVDYAHEDWYRLLEVRNGHPVP